MFILTKWLESMLGGASNIRRKSNPSIIEVCVLCVVQCTGNVNSREFRPP